MKVSGYAIPFSSYKDSFCFVTIPFYYMMSILNFSSVVEFERWWVLKSKGFGPKINIPKRNHCILGIRGAPVHQTLSMILEDKVVQKLELEKMFVTKNGLLN